MTATTETEHLAHLESGDLDPDNCVKCEEALDRLVRNAERWIEQRNKLVEAMLIS